jgi:cytochrome c biogenesis protein CcdA
MVDSLTQALQELSTGPVAVPLSFALGVVSAVASACCTVPAMGVLVAYSGTRRPTGRGEGVIAALSFLLGTAVALMVLGLVAGFLGRSAQTLLGRYWRLCAGGLAVVLGLAALRWLPLPALKAGSRSGAGASRRGILGTVVMGLLLGGGVAASSLPCNPGVFIVVGAAVLQGQALWGMLLMAAFAVGFGLVLSAVLWGVSFGAAAVRAQQAEAMVRVLAGALLVAAGLYLLWTF